MKEIIKFADTIVQQQLDLNKKLKNVYKSIVRVNPDSTNLIEVLDISGITGSYNHGRITIFVNATEQTSYAYVSGIGYQLYSTLNHSIDYIHSFCCNDDGTDFKRTHCNLYKNTTQIKLQDEKWDFKKKVDTDQLFQMLMTYTESEITGYLVLQRLRYLDLIPSEYCMIFYNDMKIQNFFFEQAMKVLNKIEVSHYEQYFKLK